MHTASLVAVPAAAWYWADPHVTIVLQLLEPVVALNVPVAHDPHTLNVSVLTLKDIRQCKHLWRIS